MNYWVKVILEVLGLAIFIFIVYNLLKIYVLPKVKVNKWIILVVAILCFMAPAFIPAVASRPILNYGFTSLFMIFFLWFMDLTKPDRMKKNTSSAGTSYSREKYKNDKKLIIKPKAKPNRVKYKKD